MLSVCEVDVMGVLLMYVLVSCLLVLVLIVDWNNNFGEECDKCVLFYCGNFVSESLESLIMGIVDIIGIIVGCENICGVVYGCMKFGLLIYFCFLLDDFIG